MNSYYKKNKEKILAYQKEYRKKYPEKRREGKKRYRKKYPEKAKEQLRKWKLKNPEKVKEQRIRERTKKNPNWKPRIKLSEKEKREKIEKKRIIKEGYIYVVKSGKYYKIGRTLNPKKRIQKYITENPDKVKIVLCKKVKDYIKVEKELHLKFKNRNHNREWFNLNKEDINIISLFIS